MAEHKTRLLRPRGTLHWVAIDEVIAPLLSAMWALGIDTSASCQDYEGKEVAWISFMSASDVTCLAEAIAPAGGDEDDPMRQSMMGNSEPAWQWGTWMHDYCREWSMDHDVRIPIQYLGEVHLRLLEAIGAYEIPSQQ
jgi:hypothetical protein